MGSLYLWGRSIQEMGGNVVIGHSIYGVVVIDGSLYSRFYGIQVCTAKALIKVLLKKILISKDSLFGVKQITSDPWGCLVSN